MISLQEETVCALADIARHALPAWPSLTGSSHEASASPGGGR